MWLQITLQKFFKSKCQETLKVLPIEKTKQKNFESSINCQKN